MVAEIAITARFLSSATLQNETRYRQISFFDEKGTFSKEVEDKKHYTRKRVVKTI